MCLLHADYHVMHERCWGVVLEWQLNRPKNGMDPRDHYQLLVERAMLDELFRQLATE